MYMLTHRYWNRASAIRQGYEWRNIMQTLVETVETPDTSAQSSTPSSTVAPRIRAVGLATLAAAGVWTVAKLAPGIDVAAPSFDASDPVDLGLGPVVVSSLLATLVGWAVLAVLERFTIRSNAIWTGAALAFTVFSLGGPLSGSGVDVSQRIVLVLLHLVVAAVYVALIRRTMATSPPRRT